MTARDDKLRESAAAYALGALSAEDAREFEALLTSSPEARAELTAYREVVGLLPLAADVPPPDPALKERVLARATGRAKRRPAAGRRRGDRFLRVALAAAVLLAVAAAATAGALMRTRTELARRADGAVSRLLAVETRLAGRERLLEALLDPSTELHRLSATGEPAPAVQLFWNRARQVAVLHGSSMPAPATDRAWQLWLIPEGSDPVPSSVFTPSVDGSALVEDIRLPDDGRRWVGFALTEEPVGGSRAPTSEVRFVATIPS